MGKQFWNKLCLAHEKDTASGKWFCCQPTRMCVWYRLRACCDYHRNNVPIRLLYVCDSMPLMHHPDAHKYLGRIRSCLTEFSPRRGSSIFMVAWSKTCTLLDIHLPLQSLKNWQAIKHLTQGEHSDFSAFDCLLCRVKCTTPTCRSLKPLSPCPQTAADRHEAQQAQLPAQMPIQKRDWRNREEWRWPVHTAIHDFQC